jgi:hypothetical protein
MHSYNTRYASMNRSYNATDDDDDADYVPYTRWVPTSNTRRPVTRSMIQNTVTVQNTVRRTFNNHSMNLRSSRR